MRRRAYSAALGGLQAGRMQIWYRVRPGGSVAADRPARGRGDRNISGGARLVDPGIIGARAWRADADTGDAAVAHGARLVDAGIDSANPRRADADTGNAAVAHGTGLVQPRVALGGGRGRDDEGREKGRNKQAGWHGKGLCNDKGPSPCAVPGEPMQWSVPYDLPGRATSSRRTGVT